MKIPIFQAPMAGITTPEFVAACANAGIVGAIGAGYLNGAETRSFIQQVKGLTEKPFGVNLFVPEAYDINASIVQQANDALRPIRQSLGIAEEDVQFPASPFNDQIDVVLAEGVAICSFTFGLPEEEVVARLKASDVFLIGTATTTEEAILAEAARMDAVVVQGNEAGGHRGSFHGELTYTPLMQLIRDVMSHVSIPVIAAGGIANREMVCEALSLGATAVQVGTALLVSDESGAHPLHKQAILQAVEGDSTLTNAFSGKVARGLKNEFTRKMNRAFIAPYPIQNALTQEIRKVSAWKGKADYMSLWAGENAHFSESGKVREIIERFH